MQPSSSLPPDARSPDRRDRPGDGFWPVMGVVAVAVCCLGSGLLVAVGAGTVASVVFGPWGLGAVVVGAGLWGMWRYRRGRACPPSGPSGCVEATKGGDDG